MCGTTAAFAAATDRYFSNARNTFEYRKPVVMMRKHIHPTVEKRRKDVTLALTRDFLHFFFTNSLKNRCRRLTANWWFSPIKFKNDPFRDGWMICLTSGRKRSFFHTITLRRMVEYPATTFCFFSLMKNNDKKKKINSGWKRKRADWIGGRLI